MAKNKMIFSATVLDKNHVTVKIYVHYIFVPGEGGTGGA